MLQSGLLHVTGLAPRSQIPSDLASLPYRMFFLEVMDAEAFHGVHNFVARAVRLTLDSLVAIIGHRMDVEEAHGSILQVLQKDKLSVQDIIVFTDPEPDDSPKLFSQLLLRILSRGPLEFKVWFSMHSSLPWPCLFFVMLDCVDMIH